VIGGNKAIEGVIENSALNSSMGDERRHSGAWRLGPLSAPSVNIGKCGSEDVRMHLGASCGSIGGDGAPIISIFSRWQNTR
jgi:hypothetical protein